MWNEGARAATPVGRKWPESPARPLSAASLPLVILPLSGRSLPCAVRVRPLAALVGEAAALVGEFSSEPPAASAAGGTAA